MKIPSTIGVTAHVYKHPEELYICQNALKE